MEELKVTVEEPDAVTRSVTVEVAAVDVDARYADMLKQYRRKAVQPGFRKGHVPADLIRRMYWGDVTADVARGLIGDSFEPALAKTTGLDPVSEPEFEIRTLEEHQPFTYVAKFEVRPNVELGVYAGLEVAGESVEVTDEELARLLEEVRQSHATVKKVEEARGLREGDVAVVTFEGTAGGAPIPGGSGKDFPVTLGSNTFPPGFEDNLIGAKAGETREFTVKLPEGGDPALAGKDALFTVTVGEVRERILPNLDDEFAKDVGEYQGLEDLKAKMRENIKRSKEIAARNRLRDVVGRKLAETHPVPVPPTMLERRKESLIADAERYLVMRGMPWAEVQKTRASIREDAGPAAERKARLSLVLEAIAAKEQIAVSDEELSAEIGKIAAANKLEPAEVRRRLIQNESMAGLKASLLEDKTLDWVVERAKTA